MGSDFYSVKRVGVQVVHQERRPVWRFEGLDTTRVSPDRPHRVHFVGLKREPTNDVTIQFIPTRGHR